MSNRASLRIALLVGLFASFLTRAEVYESKEWVASTDNAGFYYAVNVNGAADALGQYCYLGSGSCYYVVAFNQPCEKGELYPVLVSTELGAEHMDVTCLHASGNRLMLGNFALIDRLVRNAPRIGFAMSLNSDLFKVSRFDLTGAAHAIDLMRAAAEKKTGAVFKQIDLPAEAIM